MEITRRTDYAIRLISALVEAHGEPLSVRSAAASYDVPYSFARSIQHDLVISGIVQSLRGASGGMVLNVDPDELTLLDIIEAVQGEVHVSICSRESGWCPRENTCQFHAVWIGADVLMRSYLSSVSIKELVERTKSPTIDPAFADPEAFSIDKLKRNLSCASCGGHHEVLRDLL